METWMLMVMSETGVSLDRIVSIAHGLHLRTKETCFGLIVEGDRDVVRMALKEIRDLYSARIFAKRRGFTIEDTKICGSTFSGVAGGDAPWLNRFVGQLKKYSLS